MQPFPAVQTCCDCLTLNTPNTLRAERLETRVIKMVGANRFLLLAAVLCMTLAAAGKLSKTFACGLLADTNNFGSQNSIAPHACMQAVNSQAPLGSLRADLRLAPCCRQRIGCARRGSRRKVRSPTCYKVKWTCRLGPRFARAPRCS
jgi:hypothetical protein